MQGVPRLCLYPPPLCVTHSKQLEKEAGVVSFWSLYAPQIGDRLAILKFELRLLIPKWLISLGFDFLTITLFVSATGDQTGDQRGIIPRAMEHLGTYMHQQEAASGWKFSFLVSFIEIYLEQVLV